MDRCDNDQLGIVRHEQAKRLVAAFSTAYVVPSANLFDVVHDFKAESGV